MSMRRLYGIECGDVSNEEEEEEEEEEEGGEGGGGGKKRKVKYINIHMDIRK